jgi:hypothetical protein
MISDSIPLTFCSIGPNLHIACSGHGIRVQLPAGTTGTIALTDVNDNFVNNVLDGLTVGTSVKAALLPPSEGEGGGGGAGRKPRVRLSLRRSRGGGWDDAPEGLGDAAPEGLRLADLAEGQQVGPPTLEINMGLDKSPVCSIDGVVSSEGGPATPLRGGGQRGSGGA